MTYRVFYKLDCMWVCAAGFLDRSHTQDSVMNTSSGGCPRRGHLGLGVAYTTGTTRFRGTVCDLKALTILRRKLESSLRSSNFMSFGHSQEVGAGDYV